MKFLIMFFAIACFSSAMAQTKTTTLTNFSPLDITGNVITLAIPASMQTNSSKITYVKAEYGRGIFAIIGYGSDDKLSYVSTNKLGVEKDILNVYEEKKLNNQLLETSCGWCKCVRDCVVKCTTNWCNVGCLIGCIGS